MTPKTSETFTNWQQQQLLTSLGPGRRAEQAAQAWPVHLLQLWNLVYKLNLGIKALLFVSTDLSLQSPVGTELDEIMPSD